MRNGWIRWCVGSLDMSRCVRCIAVLTLTILSLTACAPSGDDLPADASPTPHPIGVQSDAGMLGFADGAALSPETEINLGDGLGSDPGWTELPSAGPGRWAYVNAEDTCTAGFRQGALGADAGMDDLEASDAVIAERTGLDESAITSLRNDGAFIRYRDDGKVAHRQASIRTDDQATVSGSFIAVRAFVAADYTVEVVVTCAGADIDLVASEVLGQTAVEIVQH